jgi:hypothetical protein
LTMSTVKAGCTAILVWSTLNLFTKCANAFSESLLALLCLGICRIKENVNVTIIQNH